jgi:hypothetical protein
MDSYLPNVPSEIDVTAGIPKEAVGLRNGLAIALTSYQEAVQTIEQDPELLSINDSAYVGKKMAELKAVAATQAEREIARLERIVAGHEKVLADDAAKLTIGKPSDPAVTSAIVQSFTAMDKQARQATLLAVEADLSVPSRAADAREFLRAVLGSNVHLNLLPTLIVNGVSMRSRLEASLKASIDPANFARINDSRTALQVAREAAERIREIIGGNRDPRARMVRS